MPEDILPIAGKIETGDLTIPAPETVDLKVNPEVQQTQDTAPIIEYKVDQKIDEGERIDPESIEGEAPDFSDFLSAKEGVDTQGKKKEKKKVEVKVEEKKSEEAQPIKKEEKKGNFVPRDYTGFDEKEKSFLKQTSNEAFSYLKPILIEHKRLGQTIAEKDKQIVDLKVGKQLLPESYYEHPEGYIFSQDYNKAAGDLQIASNIQNHWQEQLANIQTSGEFIPLLSIGVNGQLVKGQPVKGTALDAAKINGYLTGSVNQVMMKQNEMHRIQAEFRGQHTNVVKGVQEAIDKNFSVYKDEKHPMQPVIKAIEAEIHPAYRNNPMSKLMVYASAAAIQYGQLLREAQGKIAELEGKLKNVPIEMTKEKEEVKRKEGAGPTDNDGEASGVSKNNNGAAKPGEDFNDFLKVMEQ